MSTLASGSSQPSNAPNRRGSRFTGALSPVWKEKGPEVLREEIGRREWLAAPGVLKSQAVGSESPRGAARGGATVAEPSPIAPPPTRRVKRPDCAEGAGGQEGPLPKMVAGASS
ncbi:hypothetical protein NDU88_005609 [Pleurodeles waltl]|uniref:Uncharacterized protein n=1 Tax=Pleurodeles waltl TaxID=8319 RepID=A0AAV7LNB3_PLEWA|nr:hypothetical protein NDU88_005609 [Pleurodeles waltl]